MRVRMGVFALCGLLSLPPAWTTAQGAPLELGVDAMFDMSFQNSTTSRFSVPGRGVRAGLFVSEQVSIENRVSIVRIKSEGYDAITGLSLQLSGVFHTSPYRDEAQGYVNPTVGLLSSFRGDTNGSQLRVGCGVGVKLPVADYLSVRFEGGYWYGSANDDYEITDSVTLMAGISLFTK